MNRVSGTWRCICGISARSTNVGGAAGVDVTPSSAMLHNVALLEQWVKQERAGLWRQ